MIGPLGVAIQIDSQGQVRLQLPGMPEPIVAPAMDVHMMALFIMGSVSKEKIDQAVARAGGCTHPKLQARFDAAGDPIIQCKTCAEHWPWTTMSRALQLAEELLSQ